MLIISVFKINYATTSVIVDINSILLSLFEIIWRYILNITSKFILIYGCIELPSKMASVDDKDFDEFLNKVDELGKKPDLFN